MVLDHDEHVLVLWEFDDNGDRAPNLSEIVLIELDPLAQTITAYRPTPAGIRDSQHRLSDDFVGMLAAIKIDTQRTAEAWGTRVHQWSLTFDHSEVVQSRLVSYRLEVGEGGSRDTVIGAAALR